mmetsp:Transcript_11129/g.12248  ORF Transcript_11129/g.12248 Transcript_11129/m.12248 type:complete len:323 (+) Transcript_11129:93-1061(+)|eukprot:CAMPEP_0168528520 /NCGR_PEP_ID=MMETSP0405-20121227/13303_1 /TAXON_ID=498012 /ORGANISM="Trichosphaerium sp, Strain Am-I-7 wt" /LENGTH=322 /DNA_ID=CAMNT_0008551951 /DNA_START=43 /DNA_END=1011 /DNA_ORIENTATION=+
MENNPTTPSSESPRNGLIKEGTLYKKGWISWEKRVFKLDNKYLRWYKPACSEQSGAILLASVSDVSVCDDLAEKRTNTFVITIKKQEILTVTHYLQCDTEDDMNLWIATLTTTCANSALPSEANQTVKESPTMDGTRPRRSSFRSMKSKLIARVTGSMLGKRLLKQFTNGDAIAVLEILKAAVILNGVSKTKANYLEKSVLKATGFIVSFIQDKEIEKNEILKLRDPLFTLWSDAIDMMELSFAFDVDQLSKDICNLEDACTLVLSVFLPINIQKELTFLFENFKNKEFLLAAWNDDNTELYELRKNLREVLRRSWDLVFFN